MVVWLVLTAMTLVYVWLDSPVDDDRIFRPSAVVTTSAIAIALLKVRIIFREFMEVRHAPVTLCRLTDAWVVLVGACLLGSYVIGLAFAD
jgi:hypothetical protein